MVESYLNLLIALLRRPTLQMNTAPYREYLRTGWRKKVERLPYFCQYVVTAPKMDDPRVAAAEELFNLRNRIAHSAPDKDILQLERIWFYRNTPILPRATAFPSSQLGIVDKAPTKDEALSAQRKAEGFIEFLNELLDSQALEALDTYSRANPLGWNETNNILSVPFGEMIVMATVEATKKPQ